jgi:hypothetical protein
MLTFVRGVLFLDDHNSVGRKKARCSTEEFMSETVNIGVIAERISEEIFKFFGWKAHERQNDNFPCTNPSHTIKPKVPRPSKALLSKKTASKAHIKVPEAKPKLTHPGDVVFNYFDPYLKARIYLHTDLKSYAKDSISVQKMRTAFESLAMTVDCARQSSHWREKYSVPSDEKYFVRGLLFVHNHDGQYHDKFDKVVASTNIGTISIAPNVYIHFLGPHDIARLYTIVNDVIRLQHQQMLPMKYSFYHPDLVLVHRQGDIYEQPATIENLTAPYFIIVYEQGPKSPPGYLVYYNRGGKSVEEFQYFLDSLSRFQMLEDNKSIRIRMVSKDIAENWQSNFKSAKERYAKEWGFDQSRVRVLDAIVISTVTAVASAWSAPDFGWREEQ